MIATLVLEAIGDGIANSQASQYLDAMRRTGAIDARQAEALQLKPRRAWVARITGPDARFGLRREFLRPLKDYRDASSTGNRRVMLTFVLHPGLYEVRELLSWTSERRYFAEVSTAGVIDEIDEPMLKRRLREIEIDRMVARL